MQASPMVVRNEMGERIFLENISAAGITRNILFSPRISAECRFREKTYHVNGDYDDLDPIQQTQSSLERPAPH